MQESYELFDKYTFHIIPVLNVEGYIITTSNIVTNFTSFNQKEIEKIARKYLEVYNKDDEIALKKIKAPKQFYNILKADINNIKDVRLKNSVSYILNKTKLNEKVLNIWAANGVGIDQNSNSIHRFCEIKKLRKKEKFANLRYSDIPVTCESPMSFPGNFTFDRSPENYYLYKYIMAFYKIGPKGLGAIFSFHSTGGMVFSMPERGRISKRQIEKYNELLEIYCKNARYVLMDDENKYGVMDFYRYTLKDVYTFTIELSKLNANPIGPFANISMLEKEICANKKAIYEVIKKLN